MSVESRECLGFFHVVSTIRIEDGNVHATNLPERLEHLLKNMRRGSVGIVKSLIVKPLARQQLEMNRIWSLTGHHFIHLLRIPEERVPVVTNREREFRLGGFDLQYLRESRELDRSTVDSRQHVLQDRLALDLGLK